VFFSTYVMLTTNFGDKPSIIPPEEPIMKKYNPLSKTINLCIFILCLTTQLYGQNIKDIALSFNGIYSYVNVKSDIPLNTNQFTIEFWAKPANTNDFKTIIGQGVEEANKGLTIGFLNDHRFSYGFYDNSLITENSYNDESWHHWACVYEKTDENIFTRKIYLDATILTQDESTEFYTGTGGLCIGKTYWHTRYFNGLIDEVRIWTTARNSNDIANTKDVPLNGNESGLLAYWNFDENTGTSLAGISGISGTVHGASWKRRYDYDLEILYAEQQLFPGQSFDYALQVINNGWANDTYDFDLLNANWDYLLIDPLTNAVINSISVASDSTKDVVVNVSVPQTGIANGDSDAVTIQANSQNDSNNIKTQHLITSIPVFDFDLTSYENTQIVHPGKSTSYSFQIENQGQTSDTYTISLIGGNWTYTITHLSDSGNTLSISIGPKSNASFTVQVASPFDGISNNQMDIINVMVVSNNISAVSQQKSLTTIVQTHSFILQKLTENLEGTLGQKCRYECQIVNTGPNADTYDLLVTGEKKWEYDITNQASTTINAITLLTSQRQKFYVNVIIPMTGVTNGESDTIHLVAVSQDNSAVIKEVEIRTTSPFYDVSIIPPSTNPIVVNGETTSFMVYIKNLGMHLDIFEASIIQSGNWSYEIRNKADTGTLEPMTVRGGVTDYFLVKATVPYDLPIGTTDSVTVKVDSSINTLSTDTLQITPQIPTFNMIITQFPEMAIVAPGKTFDYQVQILNTCIIDDSYTLSTSGGNWDYTLRNHTNTENLTTISVPGSNTASFILQVGLPKIESLSNGQKDRVYIDAISIGNSRVSNVWPVTTTSAKYAFDVITSDQDEVYPGIPFLHQIRLTNTGQVADTYQLSISSSKWPSVIRNSEDTSDIHTISAGAGETVSFGIKVTAPLSHMISNGESDTLTLHTVSLSRPEIQKNTQVISQSRTYSMTIQALSNGVTLRAGQFYNYTLLLTNTGSADDTYNISTIGGKWSYALRNITDDANLSMISIPAGCTRRCILKTGMPLTGVDNGGFDTVLVRAVSQGRSAVSCDLEITTNSPLFVYTVSQITPITNAWPGQIKDYIFEIENRGLVDDTYTIQATGNWSYTIRNASDTSDIAAISLASGTTQTFRLSVTVPSATAFSNGASDTVTINLVSQGNAAASTEIQIIQPTPFFSFHMQNNTTPTNIYPGQTFGYDIQIDNTGLSLDTYNLSVIGGDWVYTIRNVDDTAQINSISVDPSSKARFIVKVSVPVSNIANGQSDSVTVQCMSQARSDVIHSIQLKTSTPKFIYSLQSMTQDMAVDFGQSYNYRIQIQNEGLNDDTYHINFQGNTWDYVIRNDRDNASIQSISIDSQSTGVFLVKVTAPLTGVSRGDSETITVNTVSQANALVSKNVQLTTSIPIHSFKFTQLTENSVVYPEQHFLYHMQVENSGSYTDTYNISLIPGNWIYAIRDKQDRADITEISVGGGLTESFFIKTMIPDTTGESDVFTVTAASQGNNANSASISITSRLPSFSFFMDATAYSAMVLQGESYNYSMSINNTSSATDIFELSLTGEDFIYFIRNSTDTANIDSLLVNGNSRESFIVKVQAIYSDLLSNGHMDSVTINAISQSNKALSDTVCLTSTTPVYSFDLHQNSVNSMAIASQINDYKIELTNTGSYTDTYSLRISGGNWKYIIRNEFDNAVINEISLDNDSKGVFIVRQYVPETLSNGETESFTINAFSQTWPPANQKIVITTSTPRFSFSLTNVTLTANVYPGQSFLYPFEIKNDGTTLDTYDLSISNANWLFAFRNASDTATIDRISLNASENATIFVKVTVPLTGISNGQSDTATVVVSSHGGTMTHSTQVVTHTPIFGFDLSSPSNNTQVHPGQTVHYAFCLTNTASVSDNFILEFTGGRFQYNISNADDTAHIKSISISSGCTKTFLLKVTAPQTVDVNGDSDTITVRAISQGNESLVQEIEVETTIPSFSFTAQALTNNAVVNAGQIFHFHIEVKNTGSSYDTYNLSLINGTWSYTIRNFSNTTDIDTITIASGYTDQFLVNVKVPYTGIANGEADSITVVAVSQGNNQLSQTILATTHTPTFSFSIQNITGNASADLNQTIQYQCQIQNTGTTMDTYDLSIMGGSWRYMIRNAENFGTISHVTADAGYTVVFFVQLTIPSGVSSGDTDSITVSVVSQGNPSVSKDLTITTTVNNANTPVISFISDQTTLKNMATSMISFTATDSETASDNLIITITSSNQTIVPDDYLLYESESGHYSLVATPVFNQTGTVVISITITDSGGLSTSTSFNLTVNDVDYHLYTFENNQSADVVLGQPDFTSNNPGETSSTFKNPVSVAIDSTTGKVFVGDRNNNRILRFDTVSAANNGSSAEAVLGQANFTSVLANRGGSVSANTLNFVNGIYVDSFGHLWVADSDNHRILCFKNASSKPNGADADLVIGQPDFTSNTAETSQSKMNTPISVWLDPAGILWVAEYLNHRVLRFDDAASKVNGTNADGVLGQANFTSASPETNQSTMNNPAGVFVDNSNHLFVTEHKRVLMFENASLKSNGENADKVFGQPDFTSNTSLTTAANVNFCVHAIMDHAGRLYVSDTRNHRILIFNDILSKASGAAADFVLGQADFSTGTANTGGISDKTLYENHWLFFDKVNHHLWTGEYLNHRVLRYSMIANTAPVISQISDQTTMEDMATGIISFTATDNETASKDLIISMSSSNQTIISDDYLLYESDSGQYSVVATPAFNQTGTVAISVTITDSAGCSTSTSFHLTVNAVDDYSYTWENNQAADVVLGQPDFSSNASGETSSTFKNSVSVAIDPTTGKVFIGDRNNNRILRFDTVSAANNGSSAEAVLGQTNFTSVLANRGGSVSANTLNFVNGIYIDSFGHLWVADSYNHRILCFKNASSKPNGADADLVIGQPDFTSNTAETSQSKMNTPLSVWLDPAGKLWVAEFLNHRVLRFDDAASKVNGANADGVLGQVNFISSTPGSTQSIMNSPGGVFVDNLDNLFVADQMNYRILMFANASLKTNGANADKVFGQPDFTSNTSSTTATRLNLCVHAIMDHAGRLYVSDTRNNRVMIFNDILNKTSGAAADYVLGQPDFTTGTVNTGGISDKTLYENDWIFFDNVNHHLWVAEYCNNRVVRYSMIDNNTPVISQISHQTTMEDAATEIISFTATDNETASNDLIISMSSSNQTIIPDDYLLYESDSGQYSLVATPAFNQSGTVEISITVTDSAGCSTSTSFYLTVNEVDDSVYSWENNQAADLVLGQTNFTSNGSGTTSSTFNNPSSIAIDPATGKVFVSDRMNNRVLRFSSASAAINGSSAEAVFGQANFNSGLANRGGSVAANTLNFVDGLWMDAFGHLWVCDRNNHRILRFNHASSKLTGANADFVLGQPDFTSNTARTTQNGLNWPADVWMDPAGRLWVADVSNQRVLRFDNAATKSNFANADGVLGQSNFTTSAPGLTQNTFCSHTGIKGDNAGNLYVADLENSRVLVFENAALKSNGANADRVLGQSNFVSNAKVTSINGFNRNSSLALDHTGRLYVSDIGNNRVLIFNDCHNKSNGANADNVLGQPDFTSGAINNGEISNSSLYGPHWMFFDHANDHLWVADCSNHRVLRYGMIDNSKDPSVVYSFSTQIQSNKATVHTGQIHYYTLMIQNTGTANDTYDILPEEGSFNYTIRNASDTATINTISLNAGYSETVLVKVSVPVEGIPNGHAESISITTISQNDLNLSDQQYITTTTSLILSNMLAYTNNKILVPGNAYAYSIQIQNMGTMDERFDIELSQGNFSYVIRNATDTATITSISVAQGNTETFLVVVEVPRTGLSNGMADTITVNAISQSNPAFVYTHQLITAIPIYSFTLQELTDNAVIKPGDFHNYLIQIENTGNETDTYDLTLSNANFTYAIRNISDNANIRTISVDSGQTVQCLLKVMAPITGLSNGQSDTITMNVRSQGNDSIDKRIEIVTRTPNFSHNLLKISDDTIILPGRTFNYLIAIENTGLSNDTYNLSFSAGSFSYTIRNASDTATINSISVNAGLSNTFILKASVPSTGLTNGQSESIQFSSVSKGHAFDSHTIQLTTSIPSVAFAMTNISGDTLVYPGNTFNYEMLIANLAQLNDTFDLSINGGSWSYSIRNATDTANICSVSAGAGMTQSFLIKVFIPQTEEAYGSSESITLNVISQGNPSVIHQKQITTSTPSISFTVQKITNNATLNPGQSFTYTFVIHNTSTCDDTYSLTNSSGKWKYAIRNAANTSPINSLSVGAGMTEVFLVNVSVPLTQFSPGEMDEITVNVMSQINNTLKNSVNIVTDMTDISQYSFVIQNLTGNALVYPGQEHHYNIQLQNTGNSFDSYDLSVDGGVFGYSIRNASDTTCMRNLSLDAGQTKEFIINVDVPLTRLTNGQTDAITLTAVSVMNISKSIQIRTSTPNSVFDITPTMVTVSINPGKIKYYPFSLNNNSQYEDTYGLSVIGGLWSYKFLHPLNNAEMNTLSVSANESSPLIVEIESPINAISGDSDTVNIVAKSLCNPSVMSMITLTAMVPDISFTMQTSNNEEMVQQGQSFGYRIDIHNTSTTSETFDLSITKAAFKYCIRDHLDSKNIKSITVASGMTKTYIVKVLVPTSGVANAQSDTVTSFAVPQRNPSDIKEIQLKTTTPIFDASFQQISESATVYPGQSKTYMIEIHNTGTSEDTYSLSTTGGKWDYAIRNAADIATVGTIAVDTGYTEIFLVKVSVPMTNVANGDADVVTITAMSQGNNSITFTTQVTTTTPKFSYRMTSQSQSPIVQPGNFYNYIVQIENTGANNDTYNLSHSGGNFSYVIRNKDDYATIDTLFVDAGSTGTFLVKVTVPDIGLTNAQADTVTIHTVSQGNGNVSSDYSITTQTPLFATRLARLENNALVYPGKSYDYPVFIENNGSGTDAYNLSVLGGSWAYQIRNSLNTSAIQTILLNPGVSDTFLVRVTVPFIGIANGASDTITVQAVSQALNTVDSRIEITTNAPTYEFNLAKLTPNQTVFLGETVDYHMNLNNTGAANDCYSLTVSGGNWSYTLRNADDNTDISSMPMSSGYSDTFILRVTMPQTGVASGEAETVTVMAKSQNNETVSDQVLVTTASPLYDFNAYRINFPETVNTEETTNFKLFINNTGNITDTYQLSITGGKWTYAIRNSSNTSDITSMTLGAGYLDSFIVSAYVPITNVMNGDTDAITLSVESEGNSSVTASIPILLTAINYSFNLEKNYDNAYISSGKSAVYELQINNTDQSDDTYLLSVQDSGWTYVFRNASDTQNITYISVPAMTSQEFFVKAIVPLHGISEGMIETATVKAVSMGKSSVTDQVTIHSKVSPEATFAYFKAIKETNDSTVNIGRSYDYRIQVVNYGVSADEYHLDFSGGAWNYAIRNQNDISDIGCMTVMPNGSRSFIVRVTVPQQASTGDSDTVLVKVASNNSGFGSNI
jgi:uncharacterized membrane protein/sugar lactone lactonase YvrE